MSAIHGEQIRSLEEHGIQPGRSVNWWGMIFFICSEALIFANLIAAYLYLEIRGNTRTEGALPWVLPNTGDHLDYIYPLFNTFILLSSSIPANFAGRAAKRGNRTGMIIGLSLTILLGATFLGGQVYEYTNLFHNGFTITYQTFGSAFFTLTGFHGLHVTIGLIFLFICLVRTLRGDFSAEKHFAVQAGEMYWHFVDGVWIVVFSTVYLLPLLMHA
ncbi:MAG TPA: heme-copper oxidase subunit III [Ktedonobacteraceae bacterium]|jgi:heme/copper-type cytochrome/quinol oxidase subunit 3